MRKSIKRWRVIFFIYTAILLVLGVWNMATDMSIGKSAVISAIVAAVGLFVLVWLVKDAKKNDGLSDDYFVIERASGFVINDLDGVNYDDIQKAFDNIAKYKEDNKFDFGDTTLYDSLGVRFVDDAKKDMADEADDE